MVFQKFKQDGITFIFQIFVQDDHHFGILNRIDILNKKVFIKKYRNYRQEIFRKNYLSEIHFTQYSENLFLKRLFNNLFNFI